MTSLRRIAAVVTCVVAICGAAILWRVYKEKATERKLAEAVRVIRVRAEKGEADAQYHLGFSYHYGQGVPQDDAAAVRWFRKAAEQGDAKAQNNLGVSYFEGEGVPQDYTEAVRWFRKAADQGDAMAQNGLGYMYDHGQGVPQDYAEAVRWRRKAAEHGDATAQSYLGFAYRKGEGVPQGYAEAVRWYRKAADQGDANAQYALGFMSDKGQGVPQDYAEAARWYRKAADQGDMQAQLVLSDMYRNGQGVPRNYAQAVRWYGKVAASSLARCFARQGGPAARWTSIVVILLGLLSLALPKRHGAAWLSWALTSALCAVALAHELLLSPSFAARLARGSPWTIYSGFGRVLFLVLLAGGSVIFAVMAVRVAMRGSKSGGDQGQPPTLRGILETFGLTSRSHHPAP
jgi:TPR repeat protein